MSETAHAADTSDAAAKGGKSSTIARLTVLAFILAVIGAECIVACFYLPAAADSASAVKDDHADHKTGEHKSGEHDDEHHPPPPTLQREVDLGEFSLTAFQPASNTTLLIDFHLYGTVAVPPGEAEHAEEAKSGGHGHGVGEEQPKDEFTKLYEKSKHRIRDQIITIIRSAEMTDFADPSLGLIRRKILEKSNRALGKPLLEEVIFSDFSLVEQ